MLLAAVKSNDLMYYNVGNGQPYTVLEVVSVREVRRATSECQGHRRDRNSNHSLVCGHDATAHASPTNTNTHVLGTFEHGLANQRAVARACADAHSAAGSWPHACAHSVVGVTRLRCRVHQRCFSRRRRRHSSVCGRPERCLQAVRDWSVSRVSCA